MNKTSTGAIAAIYAVLILYTLVSLMPFVWTLITSFKEQGDLFSIPPSLVPTVLFSEEPFKNFSVVWNDRSFFVYFRNSMIVSLLAAAGQVMTCSLAGYAFAKMDLPGKNILFALVLGTAFIPPEVTIVPEFLMMRWLGWIDTWAPLIVPSFLVGAFGTFMLKEFFGALPDDYAEAARLDGASPFQIFFRIYLPLAQPALVSIFVIGFINNWDELLRPLFFLTSPEKFTIPLGIMRFFNQYDAAWQYVMAGSAISILPLIIIYGITQRYVLSGFAGGGIK